MASLTVAQALGLAVRLHRAGNLPQAERIYQIILQADPHHVDALHLLGVVAHQAGRHEAAGMYLRRALRLQPDHAEAYSNLGVALQAQGQLDEAASCFRQALRLKPHWAAAHYNLGLVLQARGRLDGAAASYRLALRLQPDYAEAHCNLGNVLLAQGQPDGAAASYRQALRYQPGYAEAHYNLGVVLQGQGRLDEAMASYRQALRYQPDYAEAHNNLGVALKGQGRLDQALACFRRALRLLPDAEVLNNLGDVLREQGKFAKAVACLRQAVRLQPDHAAAHNNLGVSLEKQGYLEEALASYQQAVRLQPDYAQARLNRALVWLMTGRYEQGWPEYEWRWRLKGYALSPCPLPRWDGSPLGGRTILLRAEQGLGDTLQFVRYAALLKRQGATVVLECQKPLLRLLAGCPGIDRLLARGDPLPEGLDVQAPLLSLPGLLGTTLATVPAQVPYLDADPRLVEHWGQRLRTVCGIKVGIAWQGSKLYLDDRIRSIPLAEFAPLARLEGVRLVSLQKGPGAEQLRRVAGQFSVMDLGGRLDAAGAFTDTAAVLRHLDLVVTCDSAVGHLAGALAVPVWLALPYVPDWRWLLHREDSPWYPTARLFRQGRPGDWHGVFQRLAAEVRRLCHDDANQADHDPRLSGGVDRQDHHPGDQERADRRRRQAAARPR
jgi:tetratricopeptide (TPR) repeat protein